MYCPYAATVGAAAATAAVAILFAHKKMGMDKRQTTISTNNVIMHHLIAAIATNKADDYMSEPIMHKRILLARLYCTCCTKRSETHMTLTFTH